MISNKRAAKGFGRKIAALGMGLALTVTMVGLPVGIAQAKTASSESGTVASKTVSTKTAKKSSKKSTKKSSSKKTTVTTTSAATMNDAAESDESVQLAARAVPVEGVQMDGPALGAKAVKIAKKYLGYSYTYGGASPSTGFDCSGFTQYVYKKAGVSIWRTAQDQYSYCKKYGSKVDKDDIVPGDLLFFGSSTSSITHVGIYIGKGKFIHSSTPSTGVKTSKLAKRTNWVAAGRPYTTD